MATDIERLVVQLSADVRGYQKALDRAQASTNRAASGIEGRFRRMNSNVTRGFAGLGNGLKGFGAGLLGAVSFGAVQRAITGVIKSVADLGDEAERAGVSAESLQSLGFAARQNGVEVDALRTALSKLNKEVGEAQTKGNDLGKIFAANKLTFSTDAAENLRKVAELIRNAKTEQEKALIATAAGFGKSFAELIPLLNLGENGIRKIEQAARDAGAVIDEELVNAAKDFDDRWTATWDSWKSGAENATITALLGLDRIAKHPGFFARKALEDIVNFGNRNVPGRTDADFGSKQALINETLTEEQQKLAELTAKRLALETEIQKMREAQTAPHLFAPFIAQLEFVKQKILELQNVINAGFGSGGVGAGFGAPAFPGTANTATPTVIPDLSGGADKLEGAVGKLETVIDKFARDVVQAESGGNASAKNPNSTATGLGQFIESTWIQLFQEAFPDRAAGLTKAAVLALRSDAQISFALIKQYARDNSAVLKQAGLDVSEANLQLAHFLGPGGATAVLKAAPGTPVSQVLPQNVIQANQSVLGGGATVDQVIAYAEARTRATEADKAGKAALDELIQSSQRDTDSLGIEAQAMQLSTFEATKLRKEHELLAAARQAGISLTAQDRAEIEQAAIAYAKASGAIDGISAAQERAAQTADQLRQAQEQTAQTAQAVAGAFQGALKGFISDLINGKSLTEALTNALTNLADQLINIALDSLFSGLGSGSGGGLLAGLFHAGSTAAGSGGPSRRIPGAAFLGAPRYHTGGIAGLKPGEIPAILKRGEPIGPAAVDAAARRLIAIGGSRAVSQRGNQQVAVTNNFTIQDERVMLRSQNQIAARSADALRRAARVA